MFLAFVGNGTVPEPTPVPVEVIAEPVVPEPTPVSVQGHQGNHGQSQCGHGAHWPSKYKKMDHGMSGSCNPRHLLQQQLLKPEAIADIIDNPDVRHLPSNTFGEIFKNSEHVAARLEMC